MEIKTKYSINETVVFLADNKIFTGSITAVHITVRKDVYVTYDVSCIIPDCAEFIGLASNRLFKTKEDLIKSL